MPRGPETQKHIGTTEFKTVPAIEASHLLGNGERFCDNGKRYPLPRRGPVAQVDRASAF